MTNAEKYLKDGVDIREFVNEYADYYVEETVKRPVVIRDNLRKFLEEQVKPTLTEDERVILRNIDKKLNKIERNEFGFLILTENGCEKIGEAMHTLYAFNHLFQFIKKRRRILY